MCIANAAVHAISKSEKATKAAAPVLEKLGGKKFAYDEAGKPTMDNAKFMANAVEWQPIRNGIGQAAGLDYAVNSSKNSTSKDGALSERARLPPNLRKMKADGFEVEEYRYDLANAALKAMDADGVQWQDKSDATLKTLESYMGRPDIQKRAYMNTYDPRRVKGEDPVRLDAAPKGITEAVWAASGTPQQEAGVQRTPPKQKETPAGGLGIEVSPPPRLGIDTAQGASEFEQEKQRRMAYWRQQAQEQLKRDAAGGQ